MVRRMVDNVKTVLIAYYGYDGQASTETTVNVSKMKHPTDTIEPKS